MKWRVRLVRTAIRLLLKERNNSSRIFKDFVRMDQLYHKKNTKIDKNARNLVVYHAKLRL